MAGPLQELLIGRHRLHGIDIEAVAQRGHWLIMEHLLHRLLHLRLILSALVHILVDKTVAHEHDIYALTHCRLLEGHHLAVLGVVG